MLGSIWSGKLEILSYQLDLSAGRPLKLNFPFRKSESHTNPNFAIEDGDSKQ